MSSVAELGISCDLSMRIPSYSWGAVIPSRPLNRKERRVKALQARRAKIQHKHRY